MSFEEFENKARLYIVGALDGDGFLLGQITGHRAGAGRVGLASIRLPPNQGRRRAMA